MSQHVPVYSGHRVLEDPDHPFVEVESSSLDASGSDEFLEADLTQPSMSLDAEPTRRASGTYALRIEGRALGRQNRVTAISIRHSGGVVRWTPVNLPSPDVADRYPSVAWSHNCRFLLYLNTLALPQHFSVELRAVFEDGAERAFAKIEGRRSRLTSGVDAASAPLLITTLGRSGSMVLLQVLMAHPDMTAYRATELEVRTASYWTDVLLTLSEPWSYLRQAYADRPVQHGWSVDRDLRPTFNPHDDDVFAQMSGATVVDLAQMCHRQIDNFYRAVAQQDDRPDAHFFVEKSQPAFGSSTADLLEELDPRTREIVLVRDFRDMACSWVSHDAKQVGTNGTAVPTEEALRRWEVPARELYRHWERRRERAHLVRYEDLIADPATVVAELLAFLERDSSEETVQSLAEQVTYVPPSLEGHATTPSASASVGRWRLDLDEHLQGVCNQVFHEALAGFGYEVGDAAGASGDVTGS